MNCQDAQSTVAALSAMQHDGRVLDLSHAKRTLLLALVLKAAAGPSYGVLPAPTRGLARELHSNLHLLGQALEAFEAAGLAERAAGGGWRVTLLPSPSPAPAAPAAPSRTTTWRERRAERAGVSPAPFQSSPAPNGISGDVSRPVSNGVSPAVSTYVSRNGTHVREDVNVQTLTFNVSDNVSDSEDYKVISDSGDVKVRNVNIGAAGVSPVSVSPVSIGVSPPPPDPSPETPDPSPEPIETPTGRRSAIPFPAEATARHADVQCVVGLTGDDGSRGRYVQLWKHCNRAARLDCWDEALRLLQGALRPPDPHPKPGGFFSVALCNLLRDAGHPAPQGGAGERAQARETAAGVRAAWAAQEGAAS